jgi:hypothetical protein
MNKNLEKIETYFFNNPKLLLMYAKFPNGNSPLFNHTLQIPIQMICRIFVSKHLYLLHLSSTQTILLIIEQVQLNTLFSRNFLPWQFNYGPRAKTAGSGICYFWV